MKKFSYYAPEALSGKQSLTPEGFLLCTDVGIARTGVQPYSDGETPLRVGPDGIVIVERDANEVFRPEYIASLQGKPVCDEHPPIDVNPDNYSQYAVGVVLNPRRGQGAQDDILFADLMIMKRSAIDAVLKGKREISAGYDADYMQTAPGRGRQINLIGNHVALVESGRCGHRCAIGDSATQLEEKTMNWKEKLLKAIGLNDNKAIAEALSEAPDGAAVTAVVHDSIKTKDGEWKFEPIPSGLPAPESGPGVKTEKKEPVKTKDDGTTDRHRFTDAEIEKRFEKIEKTTDGMAADMKSVKDAVDKLVTKDVDPDKKDDEKDDKKDDDEPEDKTKDEDIGIEIPQGAAKTKDSVCLEEAFTQTVALCEVISPGIDLPKFDKALPREKTYDSICGMRKTTLEVAYNNDASVKPILDEMLRGRKVKDLSCPETRTTFAAVAALKKRTNITAATTDSGVDFEITGNPLGKIKTPAELNKRFAEVYKQ